MVSSARWRSSTTTVVTVGDPLGASVADFVAAVRGEAERPAVTGEEATGALILALAVDHAAA